MKPSYKKCVAIAVTMISAFGFIPSIESAEAAGAGIELNGEYIGGYTITRKAETRDELVRQLATRAITFERDFRVPLDADNPKKATLTGDIRILSKIRGDRQLMAQVEVLVLVWRGSAWFVDEESLEEALAAVETGAEAVKVEKVLTFTPEKPHVFADGKANLSVGKNGSLNRIPGSPKVTIGDTGFYLAANTVFAAGDYVYHFTSPLEVMAVPVFRGDVGGFDVASCSARVKVEKRDVPAMPLVGLEGEMEFSLHAPIYYDSNEGRKTSPMQRVESEAGRFIALRVTDADYYKSAMVKGPDGVFRPGPGGVKSDVSFELISNFGAASLLLKSGKAATIELGPDKITITPVSYVERRSVKVEVTVEPQQDSAKPLILEYGEDKDA